MSPAVVQRSVLVPKLARVWGKAVPCWSWSRPAPAPAAAPATAAAAAAAYSYCCYDDDYDFRRCPLQHYEKSGIS